MDEFTQKRVMSAVAGAGYGKSTFVFQAVQFVGFKTIWYRLDKYDRDIVTFLSYMISGLRNHYPDIAQETLDRIDTAPVSISEIEAVFFLFQVGFKDIIGVENFNPAGIHQVGFPDADAGRSAYPAEAYFLRFTFH